ncbi:hypothetical protein FDUTEX481_01250 [Tolypothrix sp. PCC 7601]|nr:hypothetical protein FDUTEX481_01250 [Tolypothrix sp. PCC 7601]
MLVLTTNSSKLLLSINCWYFSSGRYFSTEVTPEWRSHLIHHSYSQQS